MGHSHLPIEIKRPIQWSIKQTAQAALTVQGHLFSCFLENTLISIPCTIKHYTAHSATVQYTNVNMIKQIPLIVFSNLAHNKHLY